jgi:hypothetical protein
MDQTATSKLHPNSPASPFFRLLLTAVALTAIAGCAPSSNGATATSAPGEVATSAVVPTLMIAPSAPTATSVATAASSRTPDTRPTAKYWREWPIEPELSDRAQAILRSSLANPDLDIHTFSKVGDCQMTSGTFLGGYADGKYALPAGFDQTVAWFSDSMTTESITAANGLGISSVLNPMFGLAAGYTQCGSNETPLDCELRLRHPAVVLIAMGTNWKPAGEVSFDKYLRVVVDRVLADGALPVLATKADDVEKDWKLDQVIAQVAYDYELPLVNVWRTVQDLPNHGLVAPENIYLTPDGWMQRNYAWLVMLDKIRQVLAKP